MRLGSPQRLVRSKSGSRSAGASAAPPSWAEVRAPRCRSVLQPDAFLIEVFNADHAPVCVELEMRVAADLINAAASLQAPPPFRAVINLGPGHSRHIIARAAFAAIERLRRAVQALRSRR